VSPIELEELLLRHPAVDEVAVCGVWSDEAATDLVRAYVAPKEGFERNVETAMSISKFLADQVSGYKQLRGGVVFIDELPKSPTGKVLRRLLKNMRLDVGGTQGSQLVARL
jgi:4-coumarate--CoA ligase